MPVVSTAPSLSKPVSASHVGAGSVKTSPWVAGGKSPTTATPNNVGAASVELPPATAKGGECGAKLQQAEATIESLSATNDKWTAAFHQTMTMIYEVSQALGEISTPSAPASRGASLPPAAPPAASPLMAAPAEGASAPVAPSLPREAPPLPTELPVPGPAPKPMALGGGADSSADDERNAVLNAIRTGVPLRKAEERKENVPPSSESSAAAGGGRGPSTPPKRLIQGSSPFGGLSPAAQKAIEQKMATQRKAVQPELEGGGDDWNPN